MMTTVQKVSSRLLVIGAAILLQVSSVAAQTYTLAPLPVQRITTNANGIIPNGCIWTYAAGTTSPIATYADATGTPNGNPIIADNYGFFVAYLLSGTTYKFQYESTPCNAPSTHGTIIKVQDNIAAVPASAATIDLSGTVGEAVTAGQPVYLSDGSGSKIAGQWYKADTTNSYSSSAAVAVGMVPASISSGASGTIRLAGQMTGLSSLAPGSTYYVGAAGALTTTQPVNARVLGIADSATTLVLAANPGIPNQDNGIDDFRLTLTTAVPVTTADVTAATTLYCTPYKGNRIALFDSAGSATVRTSAEFSIAVPATTSQMYDVFAYSNAGVPTLELLAWTNDTTRASAIVLTTTGTYTKTGDLTRRYLGSFRTTGVSGQTEDSFAKRYVWNYNNRVRRALRVIETTDTWTYSTATFRQANAAAANQLDVVVGVAETLIDVSVVVTASNSSGGGFAVSIGEDSTTTPKTGTLNSHMIFQTTTPRTPVPATLRTYPAIGRHTYVWLEYSDAVPTTTWYGDNGATVMQSGISGWIEG